MLIPVRCVEERADFPEQCKLNRIYWVDEQSKYEFDGMEYGRVYYDALGMQEVGNMCMARFEYSTEATEN